VGGYTDLTLKRLWGLSGNECYFPDCTKQMVDGRADAVFGIIAHIRARNPRGPRFEPSMTDAERNDWPNLMLLCPDHSRIIDDVEPGKWPAERLLEIKSRHEDRWRVERLPSRLVDLAIELQIIVDDVEVIPTGADHVDDPEQDRKLIDELNRIQAEVSAKAREITAARTRAASGTASAEDRRIVEANDEMQARIHAQMARTERARRRLAGENVPEPP
jgi:hypothetical protein